MDFRINRKVCCKCENCAEVCPCNIIGIAENHQPYFIEDRIPICLTCGQCMAACRSKAVTVKGLSYDNDFMELPENQVGYNSFMDFLANRRSVRNFKNKAIPDEALDKIVDAISFAPFGAEPGKMHVTVINNRKKIEAALPHIEKFLDDIVKWIENPIASFMIKWRNSREKFNTIKNNLYPIAKLGNYKLKFGDRITRNAPALIIFHANKGAEEHTDNALIYSIYAMLSAHALGLGATMIGIVPNAINKVNQVREIFRIPKQHEAVMSLIIGCPKIKYKRAIKRKVTTQVVKLAISSRF
jgi:nitroreductase